MSTNSTTSVEQTTIREGDNRDIVLSGWIKDVRRSNGRGQGRWVNTPEGQICVCIVARLHEVGIKHTENMKAFKKYVPKYKAYIGDVTDKAIKGKSYNVCVSFPAEHPRKYPWWPDICKLVETSDPKGELEDLTALVAKLKKKLKLSDA